MAYFKGREVSVVSHLPVEYKVEIRQKGEDTVETVNLQELTMTKKEVIEFVRGETKRFKDEHEKIKLEKEKHAVDETSPFAVLKQPQVVQTTLKSPQPVKVEKK